MRDEEHPPSQETLDRWKNWNPQNGYLSEPDLHEVPHGQDIDEYLKHESLPRRSIAPGLHAGLTIVLNAEKEEYYCSGTESVGFKGLLSEPATHPEVLEYGFAITPGTENFMPLKASMIQADDAIKSIDSDTKACYLQSEKPLRFFSHFSYLNCFMECAANYTQKVIELMIRYTLYISQIGLWFTRSHNYVCTT